MSEFFKLVLYTTLFPGIPLLLLAVSSDEGIMMSGIFAMIVVAIYVLVAIVLLIMGKTQWGKVLFLSAGIILLVGLSTCGLILANLNLGGMH